MDSEAATLSLMDSLYVPSGSGWVTSHCGKRRSGLWLNVKLVGTFLHWLNCPWQHCKVLQWSLSGGWYCPDFQLQALNMFTIIRRVNLSVQEIQEVKDCIRKCLILSDNLDPRQKHTHCASLHHPNFAYHSEGVSVGACTCALTPLPRVPTPPFVTQVTSTTFPVDGLPIQYCCKQMLLPRSHAHCHSLCLVYTNTGSLNLPSTRRNDVACHIDTAWCRFSFVIHG